MPLARTYLPLTPELVQALASTRELPAGSLIGFAVAPGTDEDGEYAAWLAAAALASEVTGGRSRRVIASVDLDVAVLSVAPGRTPTATEVSGSVPLRRIVAFHIDEEIGGPDADLLWYDVTELPALAALLSPEVP